MKAAQPLDVAIIGASVAGAFAALSLKNSGAKIGLFEKAIFPRQKACGEGLSALGLKLLDAVGVGASLRSLAHPCFGISLYRSDRAAFLVAQSSAAHASSFGVSRTVLDACLLSAAKEKKNIVVHTGNAARVIEKSGKGIVISAGAEHFLARYLILADGLHSTSAGQLQIPVIRSAGSRIGITYIVRAQAVAHATIVIVLKRGYEIYCTPLANHSYNVSFLGTADTLAFLRVDSLRNQAFDDLARKTGIEGEIISRHGAGPFGMQRKSTCANSMILIGDACETLDPIGGMGMTHALISAQLAAQSIDAALNDPSSACEKLARYVYQREVLTKPLRGFTRFSFHALKTIPAWGAASLFERTPLRHLVAKSMLPSSLEELATPVAMRTKFLALLGSRL